MVLRRPPTLRREDRGHARRQNGRRPREVQLPRARGRLVQQRVAQDQAGEIGAWQSWRSERSFHPRVRAMIGRRAGWNWSIAPVLALFAAASVGRAEDDPEAKKRLEVMRAAVTALEGSSD